MATGGQGFDRRVGVSNQLPTTHTHHSFPTWTPIAIHMPR